MAVKAVRSSMVVPERETPTHGLWLSNLDLVAAPGYTFFFSVYRSNGDPEFFSGEKLRASLSKALVAFYPLAGRLVTGQDGRVEVSCNGEGVLFLEAESEATIDELGVFMPSPEIERMLVPSAPSGDPPCIILLLQVWRGKPGYNFLPPFLDRRLLRARSPPKVLVDHPIYRPNDAQAPPLAEAKPFSVAVLHLSEDQLAALKSTGGVRLSTFNAVAAHTWRCVCKARALADDEETRLYMTIDSRTRLDPPLPRGFLGRAAFRMLVRARVGNVVADPLERTADRIHEATSTVGDEHVRSLVDFLELQGDLRKLARLLRCQTATDLCAVSWLRLPIHETDFGSGRPVLVRRAFLRGCGWVYISRSPGKDGGVNLTLSLETEHMPAFQKAFYQGRIQKILLRGAM